MCLSAHRRFPFGSANPEIRTKAHEITEKAINLAHALGLRVIQLAGYDVYYEKSTPESARLFREAMLWAAKKAEQKQMMLAMETMDTPFINSISKHMSYESMIRSPWYRVYPDIGNITAWPENNVDYEIARGVGSIVAVHLKDTLPAHGNFPGKFKCVPFGKGCVDFEKRFRQLENLGYTGPCTRPLTKEETEDYESNTGMSIIETIIGRAIDIMAIPAILCANHGPFTWGKNADEAVYHAVVLEEVAKIATLSEAHGNDLEEAPRYILDKHYQRKHGENAYYGQTSDNETQFAI